MANYLLVHGGFIGGWYWDAVADGLRADGHRVEVVDQLPSGGPDPAALGDLQADADLVRQVVEDVREPVVLVGHSYGGMVITELADHPQVAHAVYLSAAWPQPGQSLSDLYAGELPNWVVPHDNGTATVTTDFEVAHNALCADVDPQTAADDLRRLQPQSVSSAASPSSGRARTHPVTYIVCEKDNAIPVQAQEQWAAGADHVERLASSHQPMRSMPAEVVAVLERVS